MKRNKKKILILGGASLLSFLWCNEIHKDYEIYLTQHNRKINYLEFPTFKLDLFSEEEIIKLILNYSIDIVINMVGLTNVEACEKNPEIAYDLNSNIPKIVANACSKIGKKLIHISTDHFFNNEKKSHREDDKVCLLNTYAKSKYSGELNVLEVCPEALICRTNFFGYGPPHKQSFSDWIIDSSKKQKKIILHSDVFFTPVTGGNLANLAHKLLDKNCNGIYNISSDKMISKYKFGIILSKFLKISYQNIDSGSISTRDDLMLRPRSMGLSNEKLNLQLKYDVGSVFDQIKTI